MAYGGKLWNASPLHQTPAPFQTGSLTSIKLTSLGLGQHAFVLFCVNELCFLLAGEDGQVQVLFNKVVLRPISE